MCEEEYFNDLSRAVNLPVYKTIELYNIIIKDERDTFNDVVNKIEEVIKDNGVLFDGFQELIDYRRNNKEGRFVKEIDKFIKSIEEDVYEFKYPDEKPEYFDLDIEDYNSYLKNKTIAVNEDGVEVN